MRLLIKRKLWLSIVLLLLTGCVTETLFPTSSPTSTSTETKQTSSPTIKPAITRTPVPTVEAEVISPLEKIVFGSCLEVQPELPKDVYIPWDLIGGQRNNQTIILNITSGEVFPLKYLEEVGPDGLPVRLGDIKVSPDGKWIAYEGSYSEKDKLYIDSTLDIAEMTEENSVGLEIKQPYRLRRWVDSDTLLIHYQDPDAPYLYLTSFFDPISGEEHIFSIRDLPNYLDEELGGAFLVTNYWVDGDLVPDPTMTRIIYPSRDKTDSYVYNIFWDTKDQKIKTRFEYEVLPFNQPFWALDGSDFVMRNILEKDKGIWFSDWFLISRDGNYRQITNFIDFLENDNYYYDDISRSPDGRYFVFRLRYETNGIKWIKYILLDIRRSELSGFCIDSSFGERGMEIPVPWSPDSRYINIDLEDGILIVDVKERTAYKLMENMSAYGWIEQSP